MIKAAPAFERFGFALAGCGIGLVLMRLVDELSVSSQRLSPFSAS